MYVQQEYYFQDTHFYTLGQNIKFNYNKRYDVRSCNTLVLKPTQNKEANSLFCSTTVFQINF